MTSIPLNYIVSVNPSVMAAGGGNSDLLGLLLSKSTLIPAGTCTAFETLDDVIGLFGANTPETKFAEVYFSGFVGASRLPKRLYIAQVSAAQTPASLVSGNNTLAFRRQGQITPTITNQAQAAALEENGYNYYGNYASSDDNFQFLYPGQTVDEYLWIDSFLNQLWMCRGLQGDMINLLMNVGQIPYNSDGDTQIEAACMNTINKAVNFGAIRSGVALSESQSTQIDANAGVGVSKTLTTRGWYLSVKASTTSGDIRSRRGSPPIHLWYMDGQSVQRLNLSAVEVQ